MIWFVQDFALLSVVLRAFTLALQTLLLGGILFLFLARPATPEAVARCRRWIARFALAFIVPQLLYIAIDSAVLIGTSDMGLGDVVGADYFLSGILSILACIAIYLLMRREGGWNWRTLALIAAPIAALLGSEVWTSHAISRMDHRLLLVPLTVIHQTAAAAWIGGIPFLLFAMNATEDREEVHRLIRRFTPVAIASAALIIGSGIWMSLYYVGSWQAFYGTAYGVMLGMKIVLLCSLLALGGMNYSISRGKALSERLLLHLRRFAEVEIAIGFTVLLAASSLTSQPPAVDLVADRLTAHEIIVRFTPQWPRFTSPPVSALSPATPLNEAIKYIDDPYHAALHQKENDIAWSEYSHHWAGIILLVIGVGAFLSRFEWGRWARVWPLGFIALAVFSFLRGDPENWPLGPNSFWQSFYDPEILQHRLYDVLFVFFALFEWGVETGRLAKKYSYVFPVMLAAGGAGLLLHNHALGNIKSELLIEMNHNSMGILAVFAGWGYWLELRLPKGRAQQWARHTWPVFLVLIGCFLLIYREA